MVMAREIFAKKNVLNTHAHRSGERRGLRIFLHLPFNSSSNNFALFALRTSRICIKTDCF